MKAYSICIIFTIYLATLSTATCQKGLSPAWIKIEESSIGNAEAWGIDVDPRGHIYWATSTEIDDLGYDLKCYKLDGQGKPLWDRPYTLEEDGTQQAYIAEVDDTHLYIGGRNCPGIVNTCDMHLVKIDVDTKATLWERTLNFDGNGYDEIDAIHLGDDGILCGGWAQQLQTTPFQSDMGIWKLDYDGNTQWTNFLGNEGTAEHIDGHFVVDGDRLFASGLWGGSSISNLYNGHAFLGSFSTTDGSLIDSVLFNAQSNVFLDIENALGMTSDGEYLYITGYTTPTGPDDWQLFIAKYDKNLNQIWNIDWGSEGTESGRGIKIYNNLIFIAGLSESVNIISNEVERKGVLLTVNLDGQVLEYHTWGMAEKTNFHDLEINEGSIYVTGTAEENGRSHGFLLCVDNIVSSTSRPDLSPKIVVYPNPSSGFIDIELPTEVVGKTSYFLIDAEGSLVNKSESRMLKNRIPIPGQGIFYLIISNGETTYSQKIVNLR